MRWRNICELLSVRVNNTPTSAANRRELTVELSSPATVWNSLKARHDFGQFGANKVPRTIALRWAAIQVDKGAISSGRKRRSESAGDRIRPCLWSRDDDRSIRKIAFRRASIRKIAFPIQFRTGNFRNRTPKRAFKLKKKTRFCTYLVSLECA